MFDVSLEVVPGGNPKHNYLPKGLISSLGLRDNLRYGEDVLLVREEYTIALHELKLLESPTDPLEPRGGGVVVTGQPGIGAHLIPTTIIFVDNCHPIPRKNMFSLLSLVCTLKRAEDCCITSDQPLHSLSRYWHSAA